MVIDVQSAGAAARPAVPAGPYVVLGLGRAGRAAVDALAALSRPAAVRVWEDSRADDLKPVRRRLEALGVSFSPDVARTLEGAGAVIKSPGIALDHPLLQSARRRGIPVLDEFELGWRLSSLPVVAVTGTNGKSTTAALLVAALRAAGEEPVLAGNTDAGVPLSAAPGEHGSWVVAEVSSYQAMGSPEFLPSASVLTNLTLDHLNWHDSMDDYGAAKRRIFVRGSHAVALAVLNADDRFGRSLVEEVGERGGQAVTFGHARDADYRFIDHRSTLRSGTFRLDTPSGEVALTTRLPGMHNLANVTAALAAADGLGLPRERTLAALESAAPIPGRFEPVDAGQPFSVVVDFAHSPDGVTQMLAAARDIGEHPGARVIAVMGAIGAGDRRTRMETGRAARAGSDHLVLCASSFRGEPPLVALSGLLAGAREGGGGTFEVVLDRRAAIARGLAHARPGDVVAILGRGPVKLMSHGRRATPTHFDDREVARELLAEGDPCERC